MKLSSYLAENEKKWNNNEYINAQKLINYLKQYIKIDLFKMANSKNELEVFKKLNGWLFNFYHVEFLKGLDYLKYDYQKYKKSLIYSFILSITRGRPNSNILYDVLVSKKVIDKMIIYEDSTYEIITKDFGKIIFKKADNSNDDETKEYLNSLGEHIRDGCHEISFFLIKKDASLKAVTSVCTKGLNCKYYHSFVVDTRNNVIDLTANLLMPKEQYYLLQDVEELNAVNYEEYLSEERDSIEYDESRTLFNLLRNALYKQFIRKEKVL